MIIYVPASSANALYTINILLLDIVPTIVRNFFNKKKKIDCLSSRTLAKQ